MADVRRIPFETVKPSAKEKKTEDNRTFRFALDLRESNEKSCPEFSYVELVRSTVTKEKKSESADPFNEEDEDDQVRRMAKKFEEKYGPKPGRKKKQIDHCEDYIDRGMGYDETDPFIDNDEAYDELVPSTLTTQFGGFYINSGELEFRTISDADSNEVIRQRKKQRRKFNKEILLEKEVKRRKRLLQTASEKELVDGEVTPVVPKKRGRKPLDRANTVTSSAEESALKQARRKAQPTVAVLLQERKAQLQQQQLQNQVPPSIPDEASKAPSALPPPIPLPNLVNNVNNSKNANHISEVVIDSDNDDSPLPVPVIASSSDEEENDKYYNQSAEIGGKGESNNVSDVIESVIKNSEKGVPNGDIVLSGSASDSEEFKGAMKNVVAPKLPDNIPTELEDMLKRIKQAALVSAQGKCKFFNDNVNNLLLSIEVKTRELQCGQRSMIYSHLASYLPCTKDTLLKRAKKLRLDQEGGKLADPMHKLRKAVKEAMAGMIEKYNAALQNSKEENNENQIRKKFYWNDHLRMLLCEVVSIKLKCFEVLKTRTQSAEEYLHQFLDLEVKALWPPNWMTTKILLKQSRSAYAYLTARNKKPWLPVKKLMVQNHDGMNPSDNLSPGQITIEECEEIPRSNADEDEDSQSSLKLVIASPPHMPQIDPVDNDVPVKGTLAEAAKIKADVYSDIASSVKSELGNPTTATAASSSVSPNKRIFTIMNSEEAAQLQAQSSSKQKSYADEMLNRIICASLANFPNSGSSMALPEIGGKPIKTELSFSNTDSPGLSISSSSKSSSDLVKTNTPLTPSAPAVSILKSNYSPQTPSRTNNRASVLEHGSNLSPHSTGKSSKSTTPLSSMPFQAYEFQEAFKRSLAQASKDSLTEAPPSRAKYIKRQSVEKTEPVNFSATSSSSQNYLASQELNRIAVSSATVLSPRESPKAARTHRASPEVFSTTNMFPEGMKGFPLPLKTSNSVINTNSTSLPPPPAHGFPNRRTSPSEKMQSSPHRSSTTVPNSANPSSLLHSSSGSSSQRSSFKTSSPLTQYVDPATRSIIQAHWRGNKARGSPPTISSPSHFQSGSVFTLPSSTQIYSIPLSTVSSSSPSYQIISTTPKPLPGQRGSISGSNAKISNIPTPAHQSSPNAQTSVSRSQVYSSMYGTASFPNSPKLPLSHSGSNPQSAHQRIP